MAYRHYETVGLVLGHTTHGEANKLFKVLTSDFGLIMVLAQGVRLEKSKLRYNLQNYHLARLNLIRGKEYWRLTGALEIDKANREQISFFHKISLIILRLIHGEEASRFIFSDLEQSWNLLSSEKIQDTGFKPEDLEIFILVRLLFNLGYLAPSTETETIVGAIDFDWAEVSKVEGNRLDLVSIINSSFVSSGL
ncbi:MAG: recombination protein O N-terminal domain-containing protein [Candidatus Paceibacterota bacterium]|jgi:recombinational DNA repair protein (RecF pathway)